MGKYQGYDKYKDSGVEWLGEIPNHWEVKRLKNIASCNDESLGENTAPDYEIEYVDISSVDLVSGIKNYENMSFDKAPSRARRKVQDGDTIVSTVRTYLKSIATIKQPPNNLIVSTGFAVIRPKININPNYIGYLLQSEGFIGEIVSSSLGVSYPAINSSVLISLPVVEPPLEEQENIARFLDYKTKQIDDLIAKKETLIEKLDEKRTSLISHAVTKGLDVNVPMKDSGIEWLGEIPKHWEVQKFIRAAFFQEGPGLRNWQFSDNGIRVICVTNITDKGIDFSNYQKFIEQEDYEKNYKHFTVRKNDLLLSSSGNSWGKVAEYLSDEIVILNTSTIRINQHENLCTDRVFLKWILQSVCLREQLSLLMTGSCQPNFGPSHLAKTIITIPPLEEQQKIAEYLDQKTAQIEEQKTKIQQAIEILKEYRTALITNAVTGKINVSQVDIP
ncbi:restriction endonuclease subunit S [Dolichospermum sp. LEGE 00240]|uniref:restriction endonuclease subunit S n=1 Tax=Dolichospermum sp. LEGE 00240 TaxID=1828603 RepID=UPI0018823A3F|nr:restriction endonuclease subunit S [Dolichospermum sp. LEGE 00240]MBE9249652.1 restriction endonuclease subunit S [Dolichospermum sp. LEGE 00240]